ncbi:uncharacterized protein DS421_16g542990 [Arachis hypogaea]|nr:uncharacterized protein DS421_16g542990 [Arachis hypogaea]
MQLELLAMAHFFSLFILLQHSFHGFSLEQNRESNSILDEPNTSIHVIEKNKSNTILPIKYSTKAFQSNIQQHKPKIQK